MMNSLCRDNSTSVPCIFVGLLEKEVKLVKILSWLMFYYIWGKLSLKWRRIFLICPISGRVWGGGLCYRVSLQVILTCFLFLSAPKTVIQLCLLLVSFFIDPEVGNISLLHIQKKTCGFFPKEAYPSLSPKNLWVSESVAVCWMEVGDRDPWPENLNQGSGFRYK